MKKMMMALLVALTITSAFIIPSNKPPSLSEKVDSMLDGIESFYNNTGQVPSFEDFQRSGIIELINAVINDPDFSTQFESVIEEQMESRQMGFPVVCVTNVILNNIYCLQSCNGNPLACCLCGSPGGGQNCGLIFSYINDQLAGCWLGL